MTEVEWLNCIDPDPMVRFLWETGSKRKLRLFAAACCRRVSHLLTDARDLANLTAIEQFADGLILMDRVEVIEAEALAAPMPEGSWDNPAFNAASIAKYLLPNSCRHDDVAGLILDFFMIIFMAVAGTQARINSEAWQAAWKAEQRDECLLIRDIFGNPFRPVAFLPAWRTPTAVAIAQTIYDDRRFEDLDILADALEEAGCNDAEILAHCRQPAEHVRGCWLLDLLLGKE